MNEMSLLVAAKNGDTAALETLYRAHTQRLFHTVHRITRNREDAEDAVQDSFLRAFVRVQSFDGRSGFSTWLTRIGINSALMILRKKRSLREVSADGANIGEMLCGVPDSGANPERWCAEKERRGILRNAVCQLRPALRRVVELQLSQDQSLEETATRIGISETAAKARLSRAKAALRRSGTLHKVKGR